MTRRKVSTVPLYVLCRIKLPADMRAALAKATQRWKPVPFDGPPTRTLGHCHLFFLEERGLIKTRAALDANGHHVWEWRRLPRVMS